MEFSLFIEVIELDEDKHLFVCMGIVIRIENVFSVKACWLIIWNMEPFLMYVDLMTFSFIDVGNTSSDL